MSSFEKSSGEEVIETALHAAIAYVTEERYLRNQESRNSRSPNDLESLGLQMIASRPWWRRVWILQEATLAAEDPVMQCGYMTVKYRKFIESTKLCMPNASGYQPFNNYTALVVHDMFRKGYDPRDVSLASRLLAYLGCMSGNFEATDPRDRIYGLFGFLRMACHHDNLLLIILKQHQGDAATLFHNISAWILRDSHVLSHPLQLLENGPGTTESVPSWVPTWKSKRWTGGNKNDGAPKSTFELSAQDRALGIKHVLVLGTVITVLEIPSVQVQNDLEVLRKALSDVEQKILIALKRIQMPHAAARIHIQRFRDYLHSNFLVAETEKESKKFEWSTILEDFLKYKGKTKRRRKGVRGRDVVPTHHADSDAANIILGTRLSRFFEQVQCLVVGSDIVGHIFEDSLPSWRCGDRLFLIPESRWALGLRSNGDAYRYIYRVFISDLEWKQRQSWFDGKCIYKDIVLV
jgi:hypothetical protein